MALDALEKAGPSIANAALTAQKIKRGPWEGSVESIPADSIPPNFAAGASSLDFLYVPRYGAFKRRGGQTQKFDTFGSSTGLLPAQWGGKCRQMEEFLSDAITDGIPTLAALVTKETLADTSNLDDGKFSTVYVRDQVSSYHYTLGVEYNTTATYPAIGTEQLYKFVPLWYESGAGGITRGISEFSRRFFVSGSRRMLKVGNWWHFPSRYGTPARWDGRFTPAELAVAGSVDGARPTSTISGGDASANIWSAVVAGPGVFGSNSPNIASDCDEGFPADDVSTYIRSNANIAGSYSRCILALNSTVPSTTGVYTITYRFTYDTNSASNGTWFFQLYRDDGNGEVSETITIDSGTYTPGTWYTGTATVTMGASPSLAPSSQTCTTNGTTTLTSSAAFGGLGVGVEISGTGIPVGTTVTAIASASSLTMSAAATDSTTTSRTFATTNALGIRHAGSTTRRLLISAVVISDAPSAAGSTLRATRLFPTGPIPPTHAGSLAKGTATTQGVTSSLRPTGDSSDGTWLRSSDGTNTDLYTMVDESTVDDTDYIYTPVSSNSTCKFDLTNPSATPAADANVILRVRFARSGTFFGSVNISIQLTEGSTVLGTSLLVANTTFREETVTLTAAQVASVTNWNNLQAWVTSYANVAEQLRVSYVVVEITDAATSDAVWRGRDRFLYSVAYKFEDGSIWAPCTPRVPNATLASGFNVFTVDSANPDTVYDKVTWSNLPIGPYGCIGRVLLRSPKINSTDSDGQELNVFDLRVVAEIDDNVTTTYDDYQAGDASLQQDEAGLFIRYDHIMAPRCRYIGGGDMRIASAYGGTSPCAIVIAPVGRAADYDLTGNDETDALWSSQGSWMKVDQANNRLQLVQGDGASATNTTNLSFGDYATVEKLVDAINATSFADDGQQWRAQLCPGVNPQAPTSALLPTSRVADSVVTTISTTSITKAAGGLSLIAVGMRVSGTGIAAGSYITEIVSDTELTLSTNATASGTVTLTFWFDTGDTAITGDTTYQRVISNSLPGFLYFTKTYLDTQTFDKSSVWMTVATPGTFKSAANLWSGKTANRFKPPANAGIAMGVAGVDQGFVTPFANGIYAIRNVRDAGTGIDEDFRLEAINETRGCVAWNTVMPGNRFVPYLTAEGLCAADLFDERLLSGAIWNHSPATGALDYELPICIGATAMDNDLAYASARILRGAIWLSFRGSSGHPGEQRVYDFSSAISTSGLTALKRPDGQPWGWSTPLVRVDGFTAMVEARRDDGAHLYGWNEENGGSTGDGRIDEFETGTTDNGVAISTAEVQFPWERFEREMISGQDLVVDHMTPTGATTFLDFHRGWADSESALTLTGSSTPVVLSEFKFLPQAARAATQACYLSFRQTAGAAAELRSIELRAKRVKRYVAGT